MAPVSSSILEFESTAFAIEPGEDERTNPGIYGKALAQWLADELQRAGRPPGRVIAEDFGWCVILPAGPFSMIVACASDLDQPNLWRVYVGGEGGLIARLLGRDRRPAEVAALYAEVKGLLERSGRAASMREDDPWTGRPLP
jgi:hypothetical protein